MAHPARPCGGGRRPLGCGSLTAGDAGRRLATLVIDYRRADPVVAGIVADGMPVAAKLARALGAPLESAVVAWGARRRVRDRSPDASPGNGAHDKGFLTLTGYLCECYGRERRIALGATAPLRQDIAVTGSVNQHGELQAIGGVNEKIEGFYRACKLRELTGRQGVIIPEANVRHLMLTGEVVESVRAGRFHVWSARDVDEGIELLTGIPAGRRGEDGRFPDEDTCEGDGRHSRIRGTQVSPQARTVAMSSVDADRALELGIDHDDVGRAVGELNADIRQWIDHWTENPTPYVWTKTAQQILDTLAAYCKRINDSGH